MESSLRLLHRIAKKSTILAKTRQFAYKDQVATLSATSWATDSRKGSRQRSLRAELAYHFLRGLREIQALQQRAPLLHGFT